QLRFRGRSAVAAETGHTSSGYCRDDARRAIDLPNCVVVALGDVDVAAAIEPQLVRHVQRRRSRWPAVAAIPTLTIAGNRGQLFRRQIETSNALIVEIAKVQSAV